ncbi:hypothetical protein C900_05905 [Fulvivirga imtechensis AK7]|uniref:Uncharacterized protein n=2 Tax=Fulvivirga TaxID=396811 RepID=L8JMX1_9BACT|nr:hypothetical protein C900_05905 [Fulvivirga imtechensis AK7]
MSIEGATREKAGAPIDKVESEVRQVDAEIAGKLPDEISGQLPQAELSQVKDKMGLDDNVLGDIGMDDVSLDGIPADVPSLDGIKKLPATDLSDVQMLEMNLQDNIEIKEVKEFEALKGEAESMDLQGVEGVDLPKNSEELQQVMKDKVREQAIDHFNGKHEALQEAMNRVRKLKSKYSDLSSLKDVSKKRPHSLADEPALERIVLAATFQIQKPGILWLDMSPSMSYKVNKRIIFGAAWTYRLAVDTHKFETEAKQEGHGLRGIGEYKWSKGLSVIMVGDGMYGRGFSSLLVKQTATDELQKEWGWSTLVGIKKDFSAFKSCKGYVQLLYNAYTFNDLPFYLDKINLRFGYELRLKKKNRK